MATIIQRRAEKRQGILAGLFGRLFGRKQPVAEKRPARWTTPTGEIVLTSFERFALESKHETTALAKFVTESPRLDAVTARYEAAWWSANRTWLFSYVQDAQQDITAGTRREIMRRVRWFEKNNPTAQKILDLIETNVVGTGINPTPATSNEDFNAAALKWWNNWVEFADLGGRLSFYQMQAIAARAVAVDGEIFLHLTNDPENGRPRVQLIESHRITSGGMEIPAGMKDRTVDADGVLVDKRTGRPVAYIVTTPGEATGQLVMAEHIVHIFEPARSEQYRGISLFHAVLNTLHDLDDLQTYEMIAAKDASEKSVIIKTASGEAPDAIIGNGQISEMQAISADDKPAYYQKALGGKNLVLQTGDDAKQFESNRPSPAMRDFWQYLERKVCQGVGISAAAVLDYEGGWSGAALRGAITCDNRFYEVRTTSLIPALSRVYRWALSWAIQNKDDPALASPPADFDKARWQPPRRATVDIGRDSNALIQELRGGVRTYRDVLGEQGADWREVLTQRAAEAAFIQKLAAEHGIPVQLIASLDAGERSAATAADSQPKPTG